MARPRARPRRPGSTATAHASGTRDHPRRTQALLGRLESVWAAPPVAKLATDEGPRGLSPSLDPYRDPRVTTVRRLGHHGVMPRYFAFPMGDVFPHDDPLSE